MTDLKERRKEARLTQAELSRRVGCREARISLMERGLADIDEVMEARLLAGLEGRDRPYDRGYLAISDERMKKWFHELWVERYE